MVRLHFVGHVHDFVCAHSRANLMRRRPCFSLSMSYSPTCISQPGKSNKWLQEWLETEADLHRGCAAYVAERAKRNPSARPGYWSMMFSMTPTVSTKTCQDTRCMFFSLSLTNVLTVISRSLGYFWQVLHDSIYIYILALPGLDIMR